MKLDLHFNNNIPDDLDESDWDIYLRYLLGNYLYNTFYNSLNVNDPETFKLILGSTYFDYLLCLL